MSPILMLACIDVDCIIICFSTVDEESFKNACTYWKKEAEEHTKDSGCPLILCGTKTDMR